MVKRRKKSNNYLALSIKYIFVGIYWVLKNIVLGIFWIVKYLWNEIKGINFKKQKEIKTNKNPDKFHIKDSIDKPKKSKIGQKNNNAIYSSFEVLKDIKGNYFDFEKKINEIYKDVEKYFKKDI